MITFDSFTLVPAYSDIESRSEVDLSATIKETKINVPVINANMHSVCTPQLCKKISDQYNCFSSYHRFFKDNMITQLGEIKDQINNKHLLFPSIGIQAKDYKIVEELYNLGFKNVIVDVNHGHHKLTKNIIEFIKENFRDMIIMGGNVSSNDGIKFLRDAGADIVKIGNSFGYSCTTIRATGFGVHPIHVAKTFREETGDWDTLLCVDGGIREVSDIAKSLIWGNLVMLGKMFAGCIESNGEIEQDQNGNKFKTYWGNASIATKSKTQDHIKYIEGAITKVPCVGSVSNVMSSINDGLQSAFSFVGARNLNEYQIAANKNILMI